MITGDCSNDSNLESKDSVNPLVSFPNSLESTNTTMSAVPIAVQPAASPHKAVKVVSVTAVILPCLTAEPSKLRTTIVSLTR